MTKRRKALIITLIILAVIYFLLIGASYLFLKNFVDPTFADRRIVGEYPYSNAAIPEDFAEYAMHGIKLDAPDCMEARAESSSISNYISNDPAQHDLQIIALETDAQDTLSLSEMLDFMKKLYNEGLIDPEFLTATQSAWTQKMTQADKAFVTFDWIGRLEQFKAQTKETVPDYDLRYANPFGPNQTVVTLAKTGYGGPQVTNNEKAELSLKLLDYLLSEGGAELTSLGIEGVTYNLDDKGFAEYVTFEGKVPSINDISAKFGLYVEGLTLKNKDIILRIQCLLPGCSLLSIIYTRCKTCPLLQRGG